MKKVIMTALGLALACSQLSAQDFSDLKGKLLKDSVEFAEAQSKVMECCDFLLSTSVKNDENNLICFDFLYEWLGGNPYYDFQTNKKFYKVIASNPSLAARYFASLYKTAVENNFNISEDELQYQAIDKFVRYCMYKKYKVEVDKKLQKYVDAKKDGKLKEFI